MNETKEFQCFQRLANEIVLTAVDDWKDLDKGKLENPKRNYLSLRLFFKSAWCDTLLIGTGLTGEDILKRLESGNYPK